MEEKFFPIVANSLEDAILIFDKDKKLSFFNLTAQKFFELKDSHLGLFIEDFWKFENLKPIFYFLGKEIREVIKEDLQIGEKIFEGSAISLVENSKKLGTLVVLREVTRERKIETLKSEFVSLSAHQLRTPLSGIKWVLEDLIKKREIKERELELLSQALKTVDHLIRLISELLDVVKLEEGSYIYKISDISLEKITKEAIEHFKEKMKEKNLHFELKVEKNLPKTKGDKEKILLVIENLLDNAIRYNSFGGEIKIEIKKRGEGEIEFSISDTGIGIPANQQQQIFKKFFRAANAIRKETEGSGLGLFMVKNIIEAHKGQIWFESTEGVGTTFYFTLPVK